MDIAIYTDYMVEGTFPYGGGAEIYALYLAKVLSKKNHVTIFSNKTQNDDINFDDLFNYYNIDINENISYGEALSVGWNDGRLERENKLYELFFKTINNKFDLFINASDNTLWGFADEKTKTKSIKIVHFPMSYFDHVAYSLYSLFYKNFYINSYDLFLVNLKFTKIHTKILMMLKQAFFIPQFLSSLFLMKTLVRRKISLFAQEELFLIKKFLIDKFEANLYSYINSLF